METSVLALNLCLSDDGVLGGSTRSSSSLLPPSGSSLILNGVGGSQSSTIDLESLHLAPFPSARPLDGPLHYNEEQSSVLCVGCAGDETRSIFFTQQQRSLMLRLPASREARGLQVYCRRERSSGGLPVAPVWEQAVTERTPPCARVAFACASRAKRCFVFGGVSTTAICAPDATAHAGQPVHTVESALFFNDVWYLSAKLVWKHVDATTGAPPAPRAHATMVSPEPALVAADPTLLLIIAGGISEAGSLLNDAFLLRSHASSEHPNTPLRWEGIRAGGPPLLPRAGSTAVWVTSAAQAACASSLVIFGGIGEAGMPAMQTLECAFPAKAAAASASAAAAAAAGEAGAFTISTQPTFFLPPTGPLPGIDPGWGASWGPLLPRACQAATRIPQHLFQSSSSSSSSSSSAAAVSAKTPLLALMLKTALVSALGGEGLSRDAEAAAAAGRVLESACVVVSNGGWQGKGGGECGELLAGAVGSFVPGTQFLLLLPSAVLQEGVTAVARVRQGRSAAAAASVAASAAAAAASLAARKAAPSTLMVLDEAEDEGEREEEEEEEEEEEGEEEEEDVECLTCKTTTTGKWIQCDTEECKGWVHLTLACAGIRAAPPEGVPWRCKGCRPKALTDLRLHASSPAKVGGGAAATAAAAAAAAAGGLALKRPREEGKVGGAESAVKAVKVQAVTAVSAGVQTEAVAVVAVEASSSSSSSSCASASASASATATAAAAAAAAAAASAAATASSALSLKDTLSAVLRDFAAPRLDGLARGIEALVEKSHAPQLQAEVSAAMAHRLEKGRLEQEVGHWKGRCGVMEEQLARAQEKHEAGRQEAARRGEALERELQAATVSLALARAALERIAGECGRSMGGGGGGGGGGR